ncbi:MAG: hypothetical protein WD315_05870 [Balneolaceae bacterium]
MVREIEQRKAKLRAEIKQIEGRLEQNLKSGTKILEQYLPMEVIRRSPLKSILIAGTTGFVSGFTGIRRRKRGKRGLFRSTLTYMVTDELKRVAARQAFRYLSNLANRKVHQHFEKKPEHPGGRD